MLTRRGFIFSSVATIAVVKYEFIMPVKAIIVPEDLLEVSILPPGTYNATISNVTHHGQFMIMNFILDDND